MRLVGSRVVYWLCAASLFSCASVHALWTSIVVVHGSLLRTRSRSPLIVFLFLSCRFLRTWSIHSVRRERLFQKSYASALDSQVASWQPKQRGEDEEVVRNLRLSRNVVASWNLSILVKSELLRSTSYTSPVKLARGAKFALSC